MKKLSSKYMYEISDDEIIAYPTEDTRINDCIGWDPNQYIFFLDNLKII